MVIDPATRITSGEGNAEIDCDALKHLADADINHRSVEISHDSVYPPYASWQVQTHNNEGGAMVKRVKTSGKRVSKDLTELKSRREQVRLRRRLAKQQAKDARKLMKEAKRVAKRAKNELQSISKRLKKLLESPGGKPNVEGRKASGRIAAKSRSGGTGRRSRAGG